MLERNDLGPYLNQKRLTGIGVEIGVYKGEFAEIILKDWNGEKLLLVDPWQYLPDYLDSWRHEDSIMEHYLELTRTRLQPYKNRYEIVRSTSTIAVQKFPESYFDFIYIDANHSFTTTLDDLNAWFPKLKSGGLFAGHDYFDAIADENLDPIIGENLPIEKLTSYGVKSAVDLFCDQLGYDVNTTTEEWPTWYFHKR